MKLQDTYTEYGTPKFLQSDQGREFKGAVERLCRSLNIKNNTLKCLPSPVTRHNREIKLHMETKVT